jgi:F-type H+-transporting ATPase subunit epsilon
MADKLTNKTFHFELVSPESIVVSTDASMVIVPGREGDFGVLANHAPLLSSVRPGIVTVTTAEGEEKKIFVAGGFADVNQTQCSVLAEEAINVSDLDKTALEKQVRDLNDDLTFAKGDAAKTTLIQKQIEIVQAKVLAAAA